MPGSASSPATSIDSARVKNATWAVTARAKPAAATAHRARGRQGPAGAMVAAKRGKVLNVASVAGFLPGPLIAVYYATKAYVLSFSEALTGELRGSGVTVTALCPGPTLTDFHNRAKVAHTRLFTSNLMASETVAREGYDAMMAGKRLVVPGWKNRFIATAVRFVPRGLVLKAARRVNATRPSASQ